MKFSAACVALSIGVATASPVFRVPSLPKIASRSKTIRKRQVPQEHSHDIVLNITKEFLDLDNPKEIADPVFGLLGDAAAEEGAGKVTNLACLKQETADQAFTNAKAIGDLRGMAGALLFQAIERNTAGVGVASALCDETAVNPEIAALTQHQDAAAEGAEAVNKAVTLELARQLAAMGADPNLALLSGTFAPGDVNDATGAGNSCDEEEPELGCIFSQGLLVLDASEAEISSAVADVAQTFTGTGGIFATDLVDLASFSVASNTEVADLATIVNGAAATDAVATNDASVRHK
ncbi:cell wall mannoprotein [Fusarium langsethiae]|uniref:Cell wall mannoprotein n=1 Tax=Fusarium langsethiae TaxID=179993 RepID=A0A0M9EL33_FUSLA|nr:cell wall mannoprotein [Fusarium langsethiae]